MPYQDPYEAMAAILAANGTLTTAFGRSDWFWIGRGPRGQALPYAVLTDLSNSTEAELLQARGSRSVVLHGKFQLAVYASTRTQSRSLATSVAQAIEAAGAAGTILFSEGLLTDVRRSGIELDTLDPDPAPSGGDAWQHMLEFDYTTAEG